MLRPSVLWSGEYSPGRGLWVKRSLRVRSGSDVPPAILQVLDGRAQRQGEAEVEKHLGDPRRGEHGQEQRSHRGPDRPAAEHLDLELDPALHGDAAEYQHHELAARE